MKIYNREKDGRTYTYKDNDLVSYPTNSDNTCSFSESEMVYVSEYDEPLALDEIKEIETKLK